MGETGNSKPAVFMEKTVNILKSLADENRFRIVSLLIEHDFCVGAIARRIGISEAAVSQHLQVLRIAGIVNGEKRGYFMHYSVDTLVLEDISKILLELSKKVPSKDGVCGRNPEKRVAGICRCRTGKAENRNRPANT